MEEMREEMVQPLVSIVMPMLDARRYVGEAMRSVLQQEAVELELLVVDDGSRDGSAEVVRGFDDCRVRLVRGPGRGAGAAFNAGLIEARGEFLARCDADDRLAGGRLARQVLWLQQHPDFGAVCGGFSAMSARGTIIREFECGSAALEITEELRRGETRTSLCTWLMRTTLVNEVGGCREFFRVAEDIDLQLRLGEQCRVWFDPAPCYDYRLHDGSMTHRMQRQARAFFESTARRLQQQRMNGELDDLQRGEMPELPLIDRSPIDGSRYHVQNILMGAAWNEHFSGQRGRALRTAVRACLMRPTNMDAWKNLGAIAIRGS